jgi:hypothetical protein
MAATTTRKRHYRPTESKYKGGAHEMYVTYDLEQTTRGGGRALYPKVKRVYIAGDVKGWKTGQVRKRTGREVPGVRIEYAQSRSRYRRSGFTAQRGETRYKVAPSSVGTTSQTFVQVVEVPEDARNVRFHTDAGGMAEKYREALQNVR